MILSILAIIVIAGIAYFHWIQGLFSSAISMALSILAATLAIGMHEQIATSLLGGAMADYANGMMACAIFAAVYGVGRILFDMLVPGNVAVPFYMDKVGGLACGLVAGVFSVGTLVIAAQMLPFATTIAGFSRYPIADSKEVTMPTNRRAADALVENSLDLEAGNYKPTDSQRQSLIVGVDSMVLNFVATQSKTGSLAGDVALEERHPNLLSELALGRLGIESGAKRSALNIAGKKDISVEKLFTASQFNQMDNELKDARHPAFNLEKQLKAKPNTVLLVVRTKVSANASDKDRKFRFSTGSVRLVADGQNYYPVGTLYHPGNMLLANRVDDYLVAESDADFDLVFEIDRSAILAEADAKTGLKIKDGAFLEVKRYARVDLSAMEIAATVEDGGASAILRKTKTLEEVAKRLSGAALEGN